MKSDKRLFSLLLHIQSGVHIRRVDHISIAVGSHGRRKPRSPCAETLRWRCFFRRRR